MLRGEAPRIVAAALARTAFALFAFGTVGLPLKVSTLLYCFNAMGEVLLMERLREPNRGLWSPPGGKVIVETGESPYACALREAAEEMGLALGLDDLHLLGIVTEAGYQTQAHWLMFLFEVKPQLEVVPPDHEEGRFAFFRRAAIDRLPIPVTDRETIWPLVWEHRGGFFAAHCRTAHGEANRWTVEESRPRTDFQA